MFEECLWTTAEFEVLDKMMKTPISPQSLLITIT